MHQNVSALWYGDVRFILIESPSKNQNTAKVNMKSTLSWFSSPDLLEGPKQKTERLKKMQFFSFWRLPTSNKAHYITVHQHLTTENEVQIIFNQSFMMVCLIFHTAIIINRKNWRITIKKTSFWKSYFFKKKS